ncbi:MAG: hypothetical protein K0Q90_2166, partial [Paenibacillaceae bacterium]|nr:hypothetical protein [Paenibacillaceae bacterium]
MQETVNSILKTCYMPHSIPLGHLLHLN